MDRAALKELADSHTKSLDQVFHGYVVLLNNRVWVTDIGIIFHPSREIAIRRFYNEMHWRVRRQIYIRYGTCEVQRYKNSWNRFKKENNFEVKYI